jgi:glycosyltransferase involved in cell wall biosynthesis
MKKVLIITYYWPPSGGGGVMRWLKFSKYLPLYGWQPVIFTPENPDPSITDESLTGEIPGNTVVIKLPIWEPYDIYRKLTGKKKEEKFKAGYISEASSKGWKDKLSVFIRGNLMIPDPRKFWVNPSVKYLKNYLKDNPVDVIITTGPPHSMHMIGLKLKRSLNIPWIADFRDPWTNIDFYHRLRLTRWADRKHKALEKKVLQEANEVITVSWSWAKDFHRIIPREIMVITNGYDPDDFDFGPLKTDDHFSLTHIGSFNKDRNPEALWAVLGQKAKTDLLFKEKLKLRFAGQTDQSIFRSLKINGLEQNAEDFGFIDHKKSLALLKQSQVLLLPLNDAPNVSGIIPGKLFEYLAVERPILMIGPEDGDSAKIIRQANAGVVAGFQDNAEIERNVDALFNRYMKGKLAGTPSGITEFSRKGLTERIAILLNETMKQ